MEIKFEPAAPRDVDLLAGMMRAFYELEHIEFDEEDARRALGELLADERLGRAHLIRSGEEVVGYLVLGFGFSLEFGGRDAFLDELFVREGWRGRGAGRAALEFAAEVCRACGVRALHLEVERANAGARALYRRAGFRDHDRYLLTRRL